MNLQQIFKDLAAKFSGDESLISNLWLEINEQYTKSDRYYHTLSHLEFFYTQLFQVKDSLEDWDSLIFAMFYHDIIYNPLAKDNEEKSALLAGERLKKLRVDQDKIIRCLAHIRVTAGHSATKDIDSNYFLDADLGILGADMERYNAYKFNVRREYAIFPDVVYKPGRKKVLEGFLKRPRIYSTDYFYSRLESAARENLQSEIKEL